MTFYINGAERARGAHIFAVSAADAAFRIYSDGLLAIVFYQCECSSGAVAYAVAAMHTIGLHNAVGAQPYGMTYLDAALFACVSEVDSSCGTYVSALMARGRTVALIELHLWKHEGAEIVGRTEHLIGASRNAELAGCAVDLEAVERFRPGRVERCLTLRHLLLLDDGKTTIRFLLCRSYAGNSDGSKCTEESATSHIGIFGWRGG